MAMATFLAAFPILPGKEDDAREFARETNDRADEFGASQERHGITSEEWAFQQTPMGMLCLVHFESDDPAATLAAFGQSDDEFDVWSRGRILEVTGVDMAAESDDPLPEIVVTYRSSVTAGTA
jgi:hypothetical protein